MSSSPSPAPTGRWLWPAQCFSEETAERSRPVALCPRPCLVGPDPGDPEPGPPTGDLGLPPLPGPCFLSLSFLFSFAFPHAHLFGSFSFCCSCSCVCISALRPWPQAPLWAAQPSVLSHGVCLCPGTPPCPQATCQGFPHVSCLLGAPRSGQSTAPTPTVLHTACPRNIPALFLAPEPGGTCPPCLPCHSHPSRPHSSPRTPDTGLPNLRHLHLALCSPWPQLMFTGFRPSDLSPLAVLPGQGGETDGGSPAGSLSGPPPSQGLLYPQDSVVFRLPASLLSCCGVLPFAISPSSSERPVSTQALA